MANRVPDKAREKFMASDGTLMWSSTPKLKAMLVDMDQAFPTGGAAGGMRITGVSNVTNPVITTAAAHGLVVNDVVTLSGLAGAVGTALNNTTTVPTYTVATQPSSTTFTVTAAAPGVYTSGGYVMKLNHTFVQDVIPAAYVPPKSAAFTSVTNTNGTANSATTAFSAVATITGQVNGLAEGIFLYQAALTFAGADLTDFTTVRNIYWIDAASGLPVTPNGGDVNLNPNASGWFTL